MFSLFSNKKAKQTKENTPPKYYFLSCLVEQVWASSGTAELIIFLLQRVSAVPKSTNQAELWPQCLRLPLTITLARAQASPYLLCTSCLYFLGQPFLRTLPAQKKQEDNDPTQTSLLYNFITPHEVMKNKMRVNQNLN